MCGGRDFDRSIVHNVAKPWLLKTFSLPEDFPGNPKSIGELFPVIAPTLGHAVATLQREGGRRTPGH